MTAAGLLIWILFLHCKKVCETSSSKIVDPTGNMRLVTMTMVIRWVQKDGRILHGIVHYMVHGSNPNDVRSI
jgi:hypothetical protein